MAIKQNDLKAFPYTYVYYTFFTTEFPLSIDVHIIDNVVSV